MVINILSFFVLPWLIALLVIKIDMRVILVIAPFAAIMTNILNSITIGFGFVAVRPFNVETNLASIPMVIGIISVFSSIFIHLVKNSNHDFLWFLTFLIGNTLLEWLFLLLSLVRYSNGWNIECTFIVYLVGYGSVYVYYKLLQKRNII